MSIYSEDFLVFYRALSEFAHFLWETTEPTIVPKNNISFTSFFHAKAIPAALLKACDYVLQLTFEIAHLARSANTTAAFLSRLELIVTEKLRIKIREGRQPTPIEVTTSSSKIADEEHFFFIQADNEIMLEEQTPQRKNQSREDATEWVSNEKPPSLRTSVKNFNRNQRKHYVVFHECKKSKWPNKRRPRRRSSNKELETNNSRLIFWWSGIDNRQTIQSLQSKWGSNVLKNGMFLREYHVETGSINYSQVLIPKQLALEPTRRIW